MQSNKILTEEQRKELFTFFEAINIPTTVDNPEKRRDMMMQNIRMMQQEHKQKSYNHPLLLAVANQTLSIESQISEVENLIKSAKQEGASIDVEDKHGNTSLMLAAFHTRPGVLKLLIEAKSNVNHLNKNRNVALMFSAHHTESFNLILEAKADPHHVNETGITPLATAVMKGNTVNVKRLIAEKVSVDTRDIDGYTPVMEAVVKNHVDCLRVLINAGADVSQKEDSCPLKFAEKLGHKACAELIREKRKQLGQEGLNSSAEVGFFAHAEEGIPKKESEKKPLFKK